ASLNAQLERDSSSAGSVPSSVRQAPVLPEIPSIARPQAQPMAPSPVHKAARRRFLLPLVAGALVAASASLAMSFMSAARAPWQASPAPPVSPAPAPASAPVSAPAMLSPAASAAAPAPDAACSGARQALGLCEAP